MDYDLENEDEILSKYAENLDKVEEFINQEFGKVMYKFNLYCDTGDGDEGLVYIDKKI